MNGLLLAARYLTVVPLGRGPARQDGVTLGGAAAWFPVVGFGLGVVLVVTDRLTDRLFPSLLVALLTVTVWKLLTGGLHLDGLADCLDGLGGHDPEQRLGIMRDSCIGSFGAVGLILFLMLEIAALSGLAPSSRWRALLAAPVVARAAPVLLARGFRAARPDGQGAAFRTGVKRVAVPIAVLVALVVSAAALGAAGVAAMALALAVAFAIAWFMSGRLGGITGDVLGAAVEGAELTTLLTVAAWTHVPR